MPTGNLYLIPVPLGEIAPGRILPEYHSEVINSLTEFIVEDLRTARRNLKAMGMKRPIDTLLFHELGKHSDATIYSSYLTSVLEGQDIGLLSDAGCPGVADPGAAIVRLAHEKNIRVIPLVGPSSILLALMASGSNGQQFCFHGYLPIGRPERIKKIKELEQTVSRSGQTQLFIETPFRNNQLLEDILKEGKGDLLLCIATDITLPTEFIRTKRISEWKKNVPDLNKRPTVFLFCS
jgi:16S rRNA (cytidine1402-2'-O)-methyltransferase